MAERPVQSESLAERVARVLAEQAGIYAAVEESGDTLVLSGRVDTAEARQAASDLAAMLAPDKRIDNDLEVEGTEPVTVTDFYRGEAPSAEVPEDEAELHRMDADLSPDLTDESLDTEGLGAAGVDTQLEGENVTFAPTDPVITADEHGRAEVLGGFTPTADSTVEVEPSALDARPGDEAIREAVRRELVEDATTTDLPIDVLVREGVVHLRGEVEDVEDAQNAEAVAARVPGVREVVDQLRVRTV